MQAIDRTALAGLAVVAAFAACTPNNAGTTLAVCQKVAVTPASPLPAWTGSVFTIVMENKSRREILGSRAAPFINSLVQRGAVAEGYHDAYVHPSEANYLWMVSGQNFGILDDDDPREHPLSSSSHLADQLEAAGLTWRAYQESMGAPCGLRSHGRYAAKHDPFVFFSDINGWDGQVFQPSERCTSHIVDYRRLDEDIAHGTLPRYAFITPNLDDDMHDGSIEDGDAWLAREVPKILESDAFNTGGVLFLIVISANAKRGYASATAYDTSSYLKTVQTNLGLEPLPCSANAATVATMDDLFDVPIAAVPRP